VSTDSGLEQDFNSLDAQRESCAVSPEYLSPAPRLRCHLLDHYLSANIFAGYTCILGPELQIIGLTDADLT
jgi:hypothetical protein